MEFDLIFDIIIIYIIIYIIYNILYYYLKSVAHMWVTSYNGSDVD